MPLTEADRALLLADPDAYVRQFSQELLDDPAGRRIATRYRPMLFALLYFRDSLRAVETGDKVTLSQFHLDLADAAERWARDSVGPMQIREAWVAPRGSGKSTWSFLILPAWALAHGHRRYVMAFADTAAMATGHLATFKRKLQTENKGLQKDFPDLCVAARRPGGYSDSDKQNLYLAKSGATFQATGIESTTLGSKVGDYRPDLLLFDDIEPPAETYSEAAMESRLSLIRNAIFPMNPNAVVQMVGTVTMENSIIDQVTRAATDSAENIPAWVHAERIKTHYYPALQTAPDGTEESLWPARWSTPFLADMRRDNPRGFAMNYMNKPVPLNSAYWVESMFRHGTVTSCTRHMISVDPAVTTKKSSDYTGIAVMSYSPYEDRVLLRHTEMVKLSPSDLRRHLIGLCSRFPDVQLVLVETNQGGDTWKTVLHDMPVKVDEVKQSVRKEDRWAKSLDLWTNGTVIHDEDGQTGPFERQAISAPSVNDDIIDAVTSGVTYLLKHCRKTPQKRQDKTLSYV